MKLQINTTKIPGCYELNTVLFKDKRGIFVKTFQNEVFALNGLNTEFTEVCHSISKQRVLRGLHFQTPPMAHIKLVYCVYGVVIDAVVDLRVGSPTFGKHEIFELSAKKANMLYIPAGLAHGFYAQSKKAIMVYNISKSYSPDHDSGIRWDSVGIPWHDKDPIVSKKDSEFVEFKNFKSPFSYKEEGRLKI